MIDAVKLTFCIPFLVLWPSFKGLNNPLCDAVLHLVSDIFLCWVFSTTEQMLLSIYWISSYNGTLLAFVDFKPATLLLITTFSYLLQAVSVIHFSILCFSGNFSGSFFELLYIPRNESEDAEQRPTQTMRRRCYQFFLFFLILELFTKYNCGHYSSSQEAAHRQNKLRW